MAEAVITTAQELKVEVVFAQAESQQQLRISVPLGTTALQAVMLAGLPHQWQQTPDHALSLSCFGRLINAETELRDGDRIEILRPLLADPKDRRRQKVKAAAASARRARSQGVLDG